jgi:hypothetical protein
LRLTDLDLQLEELLGELRDGGLSPSERVVLEERAARTMQQLEVLRPADSPMATPRPTTPRVAATQTTDSGGTLVTRHPLLAGALLGGGMVGLVGLLIGLALRDTGDQFAAGGANTAQTSSPAGPMQNAAADTNGDFRGEPQLPPFVAQQAATLREQIVLSPGNLEARHQLIELLLAHEQHFEAFREANALLQLNGDDPVGHYASGFVRFIMGQVDPALEHLTRAVQVDPNYGQAWLVQGLILLQSGARDRALDSWTSGLAAVGGSDPRLEHLIDLTRQGLSFEEVVSRPPPTGS